MIRIEYGAALRESERDQAGPHVVYGSSGPVGHHSEALVKHPTIIIGRKGSVGAITYAPNGGWPIDTAFFVELLDERELDLRYLYYFLANAKLDANAITTSIPGLNRETLYRTPILLPPLAEQKRIAAILDKADAVRRKRHEEQGIIRSIVPASFSELFGDPGNNSHGWDAEPLGTVAQLDRGRSRHRPRDEPSLYGGPYPFIQTGDVANSDGVITCYTQTYSEAGLAQSKLWPAGTLCITIAANIAKTAIMAFQGCFPDSIVGLVPGPKLTVEFVREWFVAMEKRIDAAATQVAQKNINLEVLNKLPIIVPPISLQREFSSRVRNTRQLLEKNRAAIAAADDLFNSLVQRAFRGEL